ncbi:MAG: amino acid racemase [Deltaproteobacteria bacterium]|nr:amino acid racemase [Deltaproteobacteria bacterium]
MSTKTIGILGGMGPEATLDCFSKIIKNTPAQIDQDHLRVVMDSNPKVPDRTAAIIGDGESPVAVIVDGCAALERAGADFIIIPCVSAHFFFTEIQQQAHLPILSIFNAVAESIIRDYPGIRTVGLLATTGTIKGGLFQNRLAREKIKTIVPDGPLQSKIMAAIYDLKNARPSRTRPEITADLVAVADKLISQKENGAQAIIAGCTEIPLALKKKNLAVPYFDCLTILARAAIIRAGLEPVSL